MSEAAETSHFCRWRSSCYGAVMLTTLRQLFTIKTKFEAFLVIYGLGTGAIERGVHYLAQYPGIGGKILFAACPIAVFMAGERILDSVERRV